MTEKDAFQIRVTGVLIEDDQLLVVRQKVSDSRSWSLPGGRVERGETLEEAMIREMKEETGLEAEVVKLLYLCDKPDADLLHITFLLRRTGGQITFPTNEFDENPISDVRMVLLHELPHFQFSEKFTQLALDQFPGAGSYKGMKSSIGL